MNRTPEENDQLVSKTNVGIPCQEKVPALQKGAVDLLADLEQYSTPKIVAKDLLDKVYTAQAALRTTS